MNSAGNFARRSPGFAIFWAFSLRTIPQLGRDFRFSMGYMGNGECS